MRVYSILFWATAAATVCWCGIAFINGSVSEFYHPMATFGDRLQAVRTGSIGIPILVSLTMLILWVWRRPLSPRIYVLGIVPLGLAAALPFLPRVENGYEQSYWLGEQRHSIPWVYGPFNGQSQSGGTHFLVRVRDLQLKPYYSGAGDYFTIGKAVDFDYGKGGLALENDCEADQYNFRCEWRNGDYVYTLLVRVDSYPEPPQNTLSAYRGTSRWFRSGYSLALLLELTKGSKVRRADIGVGDCRSEPDQKRQMTAMSPI